MVSMSRGSDGQSLLCLSTTCFRVFRSREAGQELLDPQSARRKEKGEQVLSITHLPILLIVRPESKERRDGAQVAALYMRSSTMPCSTKSALMVGYMAPGACPCSGHWFQLQSSAQ
eukprot:3708805-Prymnesium_polylepis.3